jgi:short-subunit dehydrogenase
VSAFTESLRRELHDTDVTTLHVITGGIETDMLDETREDVGDQLPGADNWGQHEPEDWAETIVDAIKKDKSVLGPGGSAALGKLASHLPPFVLDTALERGFTRR